MVVHLLLLKCSMGWSVFAHQSKVWQQWVRFAKSLSKISFIVAHLPDHHPGETGHSCKPESQVEKPRDPADSNDPADPRDPRRRIQSGEGGGGQRRGSRWGGRDVDAALEKIGRHVVRILANVDDENKFFESERLQQVFVGRSSSKEGKTSSMILLKDWWSIF